MGHFRDALGEIDTAADVHLEREPGGFVVKKIDLRTEVRASGGDEARLRSIADETKEQCPVGKLLKAEITMDAKLVR